MSVCTHDDAYTRTCVNLRGCASLRVHQGNMNNRRSVDMTLPVTFSDLRGNKLLLQVFKTVDHAEPIICTIHVQVLQQVVLRKQE